ncbi:MAG: ABC transporter ATP-binding protein [Chitinophagaceae bacterium]
MIQLNEVTKSFKGYVAVQNLSLRVGKGEVYGLLGANGAGKSTTISMLLGFLEPDKVSVLVNNLSVANNINTIRKNIGYIPENVMLYPYLTGFENLKYFCELANLQHNKTDLTEILTICGLDSKVHHKKVANYSKGMRQKVGIAIAYAKKASVYLLDEPASGLDPLASNELSALLKKLASEGASILMASHDIFRVREVCHTIGIIKNGSLVQEISSNEVTANELENIYLAFMKN